MSAGWDDYVDSANGPASLALPVQGFEGDSGVYGHETEDTQAAPIFSLGRVQYALSSPLHSLSCCSNILVLCVIGKPRPNPSSNQGGQSPQLIRIDLDHPTEVETLDLPILPPTEKREGLVSSIHKVHVDPTGRHVIISTHSGENYYIFIGNLPVGTGTSSSNRRIRSLSRLKGALIEAIFWTTASSSISNSGSSSGSTSNPFSTREIFIGTATGQILETSITDPALAETSTFSLAVPGRSGASERYVRHLYTLTERQPISGIRFEAWGKRSAAIIVTTETRIFQFVGTTHSKKDDDVGVLDNFFHPYTSGDVLPKSLELPGEPTHSELHFYAPPRKDASGNVTGFLLPKSIAWLTGPGIYHGNLIFPSNTKDFHPGEGVIDSASLIPYPSEPIFPKSSSGGESGNQKMLPEPPLIGIPISMALSEWHFVLLYEDRIRVLSLLTDAVVYEEKLDLPQGERPIQLAVDALRGTFWMYTGQSIFELVVKDEDREVWKTFMGRSNWELARRYAKTARQRDTVLTAEADSFFASGRYIQSAQSYAQSSKSFEAVVLAFVDKNERDALRYYLIAKLERLKRTDLIQRMMLATWLVEIYLSKINQLEDFSAAERDTDVSENFKAEKAILEDDMRQFLSTYKDNLEPKTIFGLLDKHGRDEMTLHYAAVVGDHERIVTYWILAEEWRKALEALNKQDSLELYYRFMPVLARNAPKEAMETLMRQPSLDVRRLIPALCTPVRPNAKTNSSHLGSSEYTIKYLQYSILQLQNTDAVVHNALLTLLAGNSSPYERELLHFLASSSDNPETGAPYYDLDYALRLCRSNKRVQACVLIYSKMGLYEASVDMALENDDLELAKINADKPEDDDILRKKLWLKIARYVVAKKNDIKAAMQFLECTDLLKIEDILPTFPDFVVIDDFKEEICTALEAYSAHIERLKEDMDEATRSAEAIKSDIADLRHRFVVVEAAETCGSCQQLLLTRQFYVFPCQHAFHADCLINEATKHFTPTALRKVLDLQAQLSPSSTTTSAVRPSRRVLEDTQNQGLKLAVASVQSLDQLRKLVLPDALLGAIGGAIPGAGAIRSGTNKLFYQESASNGSTLNVNSDEKQKLRTALDELLASHCVLCEGAVQSIDRPFVEEGEVI